jgi:hypothetical protein
MGTTFAVDCTIFELSNANVNPLYTYGTYSSSGSGTGTATVVFSQSTTYYPFTGGFAISCMVQEATSATVTWTESGSGYTSAQLYPVSGASNVHAQINYKANPANNANLVDSGNFSTNTTAYGAGLTFVVAQAAPAMSTLVDNFSTNDLSTVWGNSGGTVAVSGGRCSIQADTAYDSWIQSTGVFSLVGSSFYAEMFPYIAPSAQTGLQPTQDKSNGPEMYYGGGTLYAQLTQNFSSVTVGSMAYNATNHAWWRIRESAGTIYWDASPDGSTWTNLWSSTYVQPVNNMYGYAYGGDYGGGSDPTGTSYVAYVNTPPTTSINVTGVGASEGIAGGVGSVTATKTVNVTGVGAARTAAGGVGSVTTTSSVNVTGVGASVGIAGGIGSVTATNSGNVNISGTGASVGIAGGAGSVTITQNKNVSGVGASVSTAGGVGSVSANQGAFVSGVGARVGVSGGSGSVTSTGAPKPFPTNVLGIVVQIYINGTWVDISAYVYQRNDIQITDMGRPNESSQIQPGQLTLTLNNRDGRFSPENASGPYYPYIQLNTPFRIYVYGESLSSVSYAGYRFYGEVSEWPPTSDQSGNDVYSSITVSGIWRRLSRSQTNIGSAYYRYMTMLTGASQPVVYYPMEDGSGATVFPQWMGSAGSGTAGTWTGTPSLAADGTDFPGSDAITQFNLAAFTFSGFYGGGTPTDNCIRFALAVPKGGDSTQGGSDWNLLHIETAGTVASIDVYLKPNGDLELQGLNSSGGSLFISTGTNNYQGVPVLLSVELTPSGSTVNAALRTIAPGGTSVIESITASTTGSIGAVTAILVSRAGVLTNTAGGQLSVHYNIPSITAAAMALGGNSGETAIARFERICTEMGIAYEVIGTTSLAMGPQYDGTLAAVLQTIESTDQGILYETRDQLGLGYRTYSSLINQSAALTINYAGNVLSAPLVPSYDDQYINNDVTVQNYDGYTYKLQLVTGVRSILAPPNGVGDYPGNPVSVVLKNDSDVSTVAQRVLFPGVASALRIPSVSVNLATAEAQSIFSAVPSMRIGDYLAISNPPAWLVGSQANSLAWGYTETINNFSWTFSFNTVPEAPYQSGFNPGTTVGGQSTGTAVTGGQSGAAALTGAQIGPASVTASSVSSSVTYNIGTTVVTVAASPPGNPAVGNIWIDSANYYQLNNWDGNNWIPIVWAGFQVLGSGTITTDLLVANSITAALIAAGAINGQSITAASIGTTSLTASTLNGCTVESSSFVIDDISDGAILVYAQTNITTTYNGGSSVWLCPSGTQFARVQCWSGAAGGGAHETSGGGGGEYAEEPQLAVTPGNSYSYTVGAGGAGATAPNASTAGQNTAFAGDNTTVLANGAPSVPYQTYGPGWGGNGSNNTIHYPGGNGGASSTHGSLGGGGGGGGSSAGPASSGNDGASTTSNAGGAGGPAPAGGAAGGAGSAYGTGNGSNGNPPGGGGGGTGSATGTGGTGNNGKIIVTAVRRQLIAAISAVAGTDPYSNNYPLGVLAGLLTLTASGTPPVPAAGMSSLYANTSGTPAAILPSGFVGSLPVRQNDTTTKVVTGSTMSAVSIAWPYSAFDGQINTTYTLRANGFGSTGSVSSVLSFCINGITGQAAAINIGATFMANSDQFEWSAEFTIAIKTTGSSGTCSVSGKVQMGVYCGSPLTGTTQLPVSSNSPNASSAFIGGNSPVSIDTTTASNITLQAGWGNTAGSPSITGVFSSLERTGP